MRKTNKTTTTNKITGLARQRLKEQTQAQATKKQLPTIRIIQQRQNQTKTSLLACEILKTMILSFTLPGPSLVHILTKGAWMDDGNGWRRAKEKGIGKEGAVGRGSELSIAGRFRHQLDDHLYGLLQSGFLSRVGGSTKGLCGIYFLASLSTNSSYIFLSD